MLAESGKGRAQTLEFTLQEVFWLEEIFGRKRYRCQGSKIKESEGERGFEGRGMISSNSSRDQKEMLSSWVEGGLEQELRSPIPSRDHTVL